VFERDDGPAGQANQLLNYSFDPGLKKRKLCGLAVDCCCWRSEVVQIGLVEHEWAAVKSKKMATGSLFFKSK